MPDSKSENKSLPPESIEELSENSSHNNVDDTSENHTPDAKNVLQKIAHWINNLGKNIRLVIILVILLCAGLFIIQNLNIISIRFAWMEIRIFQFLAILGMGLFGFVLAKILPLISIRK